MSLEYAERRIKEALRLNGGNTARARQQIIAWTYEDAKLLHALTKHHLSGIVAYHVERVDAGRTARTRTRPAVARKSAAPNRPQGGGGGGFGQEILSAAAGSSAAVFGLENYEETRRRGSGAQASQQHIDAIHRLARGKTRPGKKT